MVQRAPKEMASLRADPAAPTPNILLTARIAAGWRNSQYIASEYGYDPATDWSEFTKQLRKHAVKAADFDLPEGIRDPIPGKRFALWWPVDEKLKGELDRLIGDLTVCDNAIEMPWVWLPVRKKRLGY